MIAIPDFVVALGAVLAFYGVGFFFYYLVEEAQVSVEMESSGASREVAINTLQERRQQRQAMALAAQQQKDAQAWQESQAIALVAEEGKRQQALVRAYRQVEEQAYYERVDCETRMRAYAIQAAIAEATTIVYRLGYSNWWVASHEFRPNQAKERQVELIEKYANMILSGTGGNATTRQNDPPKKLGGVYGSANAADDYEIASALQGNLGGTDAMFAD